MELSARRATFHTRHLFRIARGHSSVDGGEVRRIIVRLTHDDTAGYGEAAPTRYYGQSLESVERVIDAINLRPEIFGDDPFALGPIVDRLLHEFDDERAAVAAVDAALHDWIGRRLGVPVYRMLGLDPWGAPPTSMTIGIDNPDIIRSKVTEAREFDILKVKVGTDCDEKNLEVIREAAPDKTLRLDANGAWTPNSALQRIHALAAFNPELIEQPIAAGQRDALRTLNQASPIPIYVDEDFIRPTDAAELRGVVTGVNIKLAKCGGIRQALRAIEWARAHDLKVMLGCMVESSLGISAAAQIASLVDLVDLDGHLLVADDPFNAVTEINQRVIPHDRPGLGAAAEEWFA